MTPMQFPNIKGHFGHDTARTSRVFQFANSQPTWAARMAAFILGTFLLLVFLLFILPLILVGLCVVWLVVLVRRMKASLMRSVGGGDRASDRGGTTGSGGRAQSRPPSGGRKNVRVRQQQEEY